MDEATAKNLEECYSGNDVYEIDRENKDYFRGYDLAFLSALQCAHDGPSHCDEWPKLWRNNMMGVAEDYNLNSDVLFSN
jgi:hypothetical protein